MDEERLWSLLAATDVSVSLRYPTMGETSGVVVRALSLGRPLVVSDVGWFSELPDEVALKVPVGGDEVEVLAEHARAASRATRARRAGHGRGRPRARRAASTTLGRVAEAYTAALEEAAGGEAGARRCHGRGRRRRGGDRAASRAGEALGEIAERLREVGRGR